MLKPPSISLINDDELNPLTVTAHSTLLRKKWLLKIYGMIKNKGRNVFIKTSCPLKHFISLLKITSVGYFWSLSLGQLSLGQTPESSKSGKTPLSQRGACQGSRWGILGPELTWQDSARLRRLGRV